MDKLQHIGIYIFLDTIYGIYELKSPWKHKNTGANEPQR